MSDGKIKRLEGKVEISEEDYRKEFGINYSALSQFNISQDHALLPFTHKSYFEIGKMYEALLQDSCTGSHLFESKYFLCEISGDMPDDLISLIESGADLELEFKYNKDGVTRNKKSKTRHAYLDVCLEHKKGLFPVNASTHNMLTTLINNMLKMPLLGVTVFDVLSKCMWQVPVFWQKDGIFKKALYDCVLNLDGETYLFDIKTAADEYQFSKMSQNKYWIQALHYSEGAEVVWGNVKSFTFLTAFKALPFLCQAFTLSGDKGFQYDELCRNFVDWLKAGRPPLGYLPEEKIYLRNC